MEHTPGPWKWQSGDLKGSNGENVIFGGIPGPEWTCPIDEKIPDARLIAAAPIMFESLKKCIKALGWIYYSDFRYAEAHDEALGIINQIEETNPPV